MLLMIDNYDSFTYILVQYFNMFGVHMPVYRNDAVTIGEIEKLKPEGIVISPGPGNPDGAGISLQVIERFAGIVPLLGVCLGHQAIAQAYGGRIIQARRLMHGKTSKIYHNGEGVFSGLASPFTATRYHSLILDPKSIPDCFEVAARAEHDEVMGLRHRELPLEGVQFHPESVLTGEGMCLLHNFLSIYQIGRDKKSFLTGIPERSRNNVSPH